jgi:NTP pyrophosphatase (non-canonical NTP hydrolase)
MTIEKQREIEKRAIETYGFNTQILVVLEEMAELTQVITKLLRTDVPCSTYAAQNLLEEIADVKIMLDQLEQMLKIDDSLIDEEMDYKLNRLEQRLNERDQRK